MRYMFALAAVIVPIAGGALLGVLKFKKQIHRNIYVVATLVFCAAFTGAAALSSDISVNLLKVARGFEFAFKVDDLSRFFSLLAVLIWLIVTVYSFGYMENEHAQERFYAFFLMTAGAVQGICYAGNLITMYVFYEAMTLASFPLVLHEQSPAAFAACKKYLIYSFAGAALALIGIFYFSFISEGAAFTAGGIARIAQYADKKYMAGIYFIMILGFGCKAGMFPLNAWLTSAHPTAPSPASAVLSGIITKMGVFAIIRTTFYVVGTEFVAGSWMQTALLMLAGVSVLIGSVLAYRTDHLKKRLAYSTVSQVSYILLGVFLLNENAFKGALLHVAFHALMKSVMFLSAGAFIFKTHKIHVSEMKGIGKMMPKTMLFFTVAALCMIGVPPLGGFISKTYLVMGAFNFGGYLSYTLGGLLILSALFSAGYLLPIIVGGYFPGHDYETVYINKEPPASMRISIGTAAALLSIISVLPGALTAFIADIIIKLF